MPGCAQTFLSHSLQSSELSGAVGVLCHRTPYTIGPGYSLRPYPRQYIDGGCQFRLPRTFTSWTPEGWISMVLGGRPVHQGSAYTVNIHNIPHYNQNDRKWSITHNNNNKVNHSHSNNSNNNNNERSLQGQPKISFRPSPPFIIKISFSSEINKVIFQTEYC